MNIKRVKNILLMAAFAIVAASCQKNGPQDGELYGDSIVRFAPSVVNITEAIDTKGTLINGDDPFDTSKSFFVRAWDNATSANIIPGGEGYQEVKRKGNQWNTVYTKGDKEYAKEYIWKKNETKVFYAYANIPDSGVEFANTSAGAQSMTYTVPASASEQKDILMGYYSGNGTTGTGEDAKMTGTASIVFSHPLTAVQFVYGDIAGNLAIKSISLAKVAGTGTAKMGANGTISWTSVGTLNYTVSQTNDSGLSVDSTTKLIGEPFIIIPQNVATDHVTVNVTFTNDVTASVTISSGQWETGKNYIYKLKYVVDMASELSVTLVDWTNLLSKDGDEIFDVEFGTKPTV